MTLAYGGCIEPGGWELDEERTTAECPQCGASAHSWRIERAEAGFINLYVGLSCSACSFSRGDNPADDD